MSALTPGQVAKIDGSRLNLWAIKPAPHEGK